MKKSLALSSTRPSKRGAAPLLTGSPTSPRAAHRALVEDLLTAIERFVQQTVDAQVEAALASMGVGERGSRRPPVERRRASGGGAIEAGLPRPAGGGAPPPRPPAAEPAPPPAAPAFATPAAPPRTQGFPTRVLPDWMKEMLAADAKPGPALESAAPDADEIGAIEREVAAKLETLPSLPRPQMTAQLAIWAGRARAVQDEVNAAGTEGSRRAAVRILFTKLSALRRELDPEFIPAFASEWQMDWRLFTEVQQAELVGRDEEPPADKRRQFHQQMIRALLRGPFVPRAFAVSTIGAAARWLPPEDRDLHAAVEKFGRPPELR
jgi:hypothetical protein